MVMLYEDVLFERGYYDRVKNTGPVMISFAWQCSKLPQQFGSDFKEPARLLPEIRSGFSCSGAMRCGSSKHGYKIYEQRRSGIRETNPQRCWGQRQLYL
jgi:hypothetical protein